MKLLKKMSTFVVALTFLFVFSIKANAAESYKVGDKVLFGDFGGHVIENSDSNSNTVKVFVDGWNKSKEDWESYWDKKLQKDGVTSGIYWDTDKIDNVYKSQIKNLNNYALDGTNYEMIVKLLGVESNDYGEYVISSDSELVKKYSWLFNSNIYGGELKNIHHFKCNEVRSDFGETEECGQYVGTYLVRYKKDEKRDIDADYPVYFGTRASDYIITTSVQASCTVRQQFCTYYNNG